VNKKLTLKILGQPDPALPKDIHLVGRYALGGTWADDHGSIIPSSRCAAAAPVARARRCRR